jgi:hypothetical protein
MREAARCLRPVARGHHRRPGRHHHPPPGPPGPGPAVETDTADGPAGAARNAPHPLPARSANPGLSHRPGRPETASPVGATRTLGPADRSIPTTARSASADSEVRPDTGHRPYARSQPEPGSQGRKHNPHPPCRLFTSLRGRPPLLYPAQISPFGWSSVAAIGGVARCPPRLVPELLACYRQRSGSHWDARRGRGFPAVPVGDPHQHRAEKDDTMTSWPTAGVASPSTAPTRPHLPSSGASCWAGRSLRSTTVPAGQQSAPGSMSFPG